jgi:hypothetical protein
MKIFLISLVTVFLVCLIVQVKGQNYGIPVGSVLVYDQSSPLFKNEDGTYSTRVPITICNRRWGIDMCDRFITNVTFDYEYRKLR